MLLEVPGLTTTWGRSTRHCLVDCGAELKILPPLGEACVCVTLGIIGILSDCFSFTVVFLVQQGDMAYNQGPCPTKLPDCTGSES